MRTKEQILETLVHDNVPSMNTSLLETLIDIRDILENKLHDLINCLENIDSSLNHK